MRKSVCIMLCLAVLIATASCAKQKPEPAAENATESVAEATKTEVTTEQETETETETEATETEPETEEVTELETDPEAETQTEEPEQLVTAAEVFAYLKDNTSNIGKSVEYDEESDVNGLLGRPNQYTSKINFEITTVEQTDPEDPKGGSIEVFSNVEDAQARYDYIQELGKSMTFLAEYDYLNDYVLLRINYDVTPSDEKQYEEALDAFMESVQKAET